jgi:hypothetical protein
MHDIPVDLTPSDGRFRRWGRGAAAVILLSLGVGSATAAFSVVSRIVPHGAPSVSCETTIDYTSDPSSAMSAGIPSQAQLRETISDAYQTSYEAAGDVVGTLADVSMDTEDAGEGPMAIVAAVALGLLVLCTRGAATLLVVPRTTMFVAGTALGALAIASMLVATFGLPGIGLRAAAFAAAVALLAVRHARASYVSPRRPQN